MFSSTQFHDLPVFPQGQITNQVELFLTEDPTICQLSSRADFLHGEILLQHNPTIYQIPSWVDYQPGEISKWSSPCHPVNIVRFFGANNKPGSLNLVQNFVDYKMIEAEL